MQKIPLTVQPILRRAIAAQQKGRLAEAMELYKKVLKKLPQNLDALQGLATLALGSGDMQAAINLISQAIKLAPGDTQVRNNYAQILFSHGNYLANQEARYQEALGCYDQALKIKPDFKEAWNNGGITLEKLGRPQHALMSYEKAISCAADYVEALKNRATLLMEINRFTDAAKSYSDAWKIDKNDMAALAGMLWARLKVCDWSDYAENLEKLENAALQKKKHIDPGIFLNISQSAEAQWHCAMSHVENTLGVKPSTHSAKVFSTNGRYSHNKIRIAYISADFREHPISWLMVKLFELHDKNRFEVTAISLFEADDLMRTRLKPLFDHFIDVHDKNDREVIELIRSREIDIAIDLMGYTLHGRPEIFASRVAPVQVAYMGMAGTTGASYIDYVIADRTIIPAENEPFFTENVVIMPDTYWVTDDSYKIKLPLPSRQDAGLPETGFVFCCFNTIHKLTPFMFEIWMRLLRKIEGSILWLATSDASAKENLQREAQHHGVDPARLVFASNVTHDEHESRLCLADLVLDSLPYNAHTTTSDALWAGVPVITCVGSSFAARVAASLLYAAEMPELITNNLHDYEMLALKIAQTPELLIEIRYKLNEKLKTCSLFDTDRFRRHLESAYITMHSRYQNGQSPSRLVVEKNP